MSKKGNIGLFAALFLSIGGIYYSLKRVNAKKEKSKKEQEAQEDNFFEPEPSTEDIEQVLFSETETFDNFNTGKKAAKTSRLQSIRSIGNTLKNSSIDRLRRANNPQVYTAFYKWLQEKFTKSQVVITNPLDRPQNVVLWGADSGLNINNEMNAQNVEETTILAEVLTGIEGGIIGAQPQGIIVNPLNGFTYVANQLSGNVVVIDQEGTKVNDISLVSRAILIVGGVSPVALAVNTNENSAQYGKVYTANSVANTITTIQAATEVINIPTVTQIQVGTRPMDIAFNPINGYLYTANLFDDTVTVIDTETESPVVTLNVETDPIGIGINTSNGDIYVANSTRNSISVFDRTNTLITVISNIGNMPVSATYQPNTNEMYIVLANDNAVIPIDATTYEVGQAIAVGNNPYSAVYNPINDFVYIGNRDDNTLTVIAPDKTIRATLALTNVNIGLAVNNETGTLWLSDTANNTVRALGFNQGSTLVFNDEYEADAMRFASHPILLKHVKFSLSGQERFNVLRHIEQNATGCKEVMSLSHENYRSPNNFLNVSEIYDLENTIVDGRVSWEFTIAPKQTISIMLYYLQFERADYIPNS